jgi:flagellar biosynthesis chaperone FliJ
VAFRFSLEPVLRLRMSYEKLERLRLLALAAMIVRVHEEIAAAVREDAAVREARREMLSRGMAAAEIKLGVVGEQQRAKRSRELTERLAALVRQHTKQSRAYQVARRKREILQKLREEHLRQYQREQDRLQQQALDELYLMRRNVPAE